jgi:hypothetical protein
MTLVQLVQIIGHILTQLDQILSDPNFLTSDPDWQQLYAMRVHLDNQQRQLVALTFQLDDAKYDSLTSQITAANTSLKQQIAELANIGNIISTVAKVAALADQVISLATL